MGICDTSGRLCRVERHRTCESESLLGRVCDTRVHALSPPGIHRICRPDRSRLSLFIFIHRFLYHTPLCRPELPLADKAKAMIVL